MIPLTARRWLYDRTVDVLDATVGLGASRPPPLDRLEPGQLTVTGFFDRTSGIGRAGRLTAAALQRIGWPVTRDNVEDHFGGLAILRPRVLPGAASGVWLIHANPRDCAMMGLSRARKQWVDRARIGYWAWETPVAPGSWVRMARAFHEIWVPSDFVADALRAAGGAAVANKLRVMPHPVRAIAGRRRHDRFGLDPAKIHVLAMADQRSSLTRKNPWGAIEAWRTAFPQPATNAVLVVKSSAVDNHDPAILALRAAVAERPDIILMQAWLTDAEVDDLLATVDAVVSLHRAEGFGLVLAEAMVQGKPVIATGWSGNLQFMNPSNAVLVPYRLAPIVDASGLYASGSWAEPDIRSAAESLAAVVADEALRRRLGEAGRGVAGLLAEAWSAEALARTPLGKLVRG